jgi:thiosulfate reductase cytochrome b subunit
MHRVGAAAIICMIMSGWQIYNVSALLPFAFPRWMTLGGWLAAALPGGFWEDQGHNWFSGS